MPDHGGGPGDGKSGYSGGAESNAAPEPRSRADDLLLAMGQKPIQYTPWPTFPTAISGATVPLLTATAASGPG